MKKQEFSKETERGKGELLSLYNAVRGSHYTNSDELEIGRKEGERVLILNQKLLFDYRIEDLKQASEDEDYRRKLYAEYGIL